jgi:D-amino-acid dehydrogenase
MSTMKFDAVLLGAGIVGVCVVLRLQKPRGRKSFRVERF